MGVALPLATILPERRRVGKRSFEESWPGWVGLDGVHATDPFRLVRPYFSHSLPMGGQIKNL